MKLQFSDLFLVGLCICCAPMLARGDVLAHGTTESYWVVTTRTDAQGAIQSLVQHRPVNSAAAWKTIARVNGPLRQLTHLRRDLVALLDNGEWMILRQGSSSTGNSPEDRTKLIHLAGDNETLWAVGASGLGRGPTTSGATQPAATMDPNTRLLYRLERGEWRMLARLPNEAQDAKAFSLGPVDQTMMLAALFEGGRVMTFQFDSIARSWRAMGESQFPATVNRIKLMPNLGRPTIWGIEPRSAGLLSWRDAEWAAPVPLAVPAEKLGDGAQDAAVAGRSIRLLVETDGKINEFSYDRAGVTQGEPVTVPAPVVAPDPEEYEWLTGVAAAALLIVLMNTLRRREPVTPEMVEASGVQLAPYGRRLLAGVIDALPILGTGTIMLLGLKDGSQEEIEAMYERSRYPMYIAMGVGILHVLVCELLWGWSIGKRLLGLRVAMIDGSAPIARAIILRNVLRVLDVMMLYAPLLIVLLSPLRQRIGDIVAETIVIRDTVVKIEEKPKE